jgi:hypothetical protein
MHMVHFHDVGVLCKAVSLFGAVLEAGLRRKVTPLPPGRLDD